jgi:hypothetical protein
MGISRSEILESRKLETEPWNSRRDNDVGLGARRQVPRVVRSAVVLTDLGGPVIVTSARCAVIVASTRCAVVETSTTAAVVITATATSVIEVAAAAVTTATTS